MGSALSSTSRSGSDSCRFALAFGFRFGCEGLGARTALPAASERSPFELITSNSQPHQPCPNNDIGESNISFCQVDEGINQLLLALPDS